MSLNNRQRRELRRLGASLGRSDPHLGAMFSIFGRLYPERDLPDWEQEASEPGTPGRIRRAVVRRRSRTQAQAARHEGTRFDREADAQ